jgi:hypothetical protein
VSARRPTRLSVGVLTALAALGILASLLTGRKAPLPRATSTTGIAMGQSCSQGTADWLDQLNAATERARISGAYCSAADGQLILVKMRTSDGHAMRWRADKGTAALQFRLESGGE